MTEAEWLASEDSVAMLEHLTTEADPGSSVRWRRAVPLVSERKLRLWCHAMNAKAFGFKADKFPLDESPTHWNTDAVGDAMCCASRSYPVPQEYGAALLREIAGNPFRPVTLCGMERKPFHNQHAHVAKNGGFWLEDECPACRDIRTHVVLALSQSAYDERQPDGTLDPDRLAVLSDALEEAGCPESVTCPVCGGRKVVPILEGFDDDLREFACPRCEGRGVVFLLLLTHLRSPGPHVRGCWVLDLIRGVE